MRFGSIAILATVWFSVQSAHASPFLAPGDAALRRDIQFLADTGVIKGTVSTWPLAWGPILDDIRHFDSQGDVPLELLSVITRVRDRGEWETRVGSAQYKARASLTSNPTRIRSFDNTPREESVLSGGVDWIGDRFSIDLNLTAVSSPSDGQEFRGDGSQISAALGNWTISANTYERWWGPGWDGSLILSNNARPFPSLSIDRNFPLPFRSKWLRWLGPWDLSVMFGQLEADRAVPNTHFFGMRFDFRPMPSLEIGLSRTALWCGDGRPCDLGKFANLLIGNDNVSANNVGPSKEPGDQLAGLDFRWGIGSTTHRHAVYGQFIGEDEAGGFPSRYLAQLGVDTSGFWSDDWSYQAFAELALTNCGFRQTEQFLNCAYNHNIYQTGYRYRGRTIGHGADNDSRILSAGLIVIDSKDRVWKALLRYANLNRLGPPDPHNSLTPTQQDIASIDLMHRRQFRYGILEFGLGYERINDIASTRTEGDVRAFLSWKSAY